LRHTFQESVAPKWLEINQDNLRMRFSALNVDFSSKVAIPLNSIKRAVHASFKEGYPQFYRYWLVERENSCS